MGRLFGVHLGLLIAMAVVACESGEIVDGVTDSTFVAALADLQRVQTDPRLDSAARDNARDSILQGRGLTVEQLDRAALVLADDPRRARELLQAVRAKLIPGEDSAATATGKPAGVRSTLDSATP